MFDLPLEDLASRTQRRTGASCYEYESDTIHLSERRFDELTHFAHELQHYFFHVGTPYGQLLDELALARQFLGKNYMETTEGAVIYPAYGLAQKFYAGTLQLRDGEVNADSLKMIAERIIYPWSQIRFLENLLEARRCHSVRNASIKSAIKALEVAERLQAETLDYSDKGLFSIRPDKEPVEPLVLDDEDLELSACPTLLLAETGEKIPIGALDIFEGVAQSIEGVAPGHEAGLEYILLWSHTLSCLDFPDDPTGEEIEAARCTFLSLCDLALYVPAGAIYGRLRRPKMRWVDIHPGWRFKRCVQVVSELGLISNLAEESDELQTTLCEGFGWPTPIQFHTLAAELTGSAFGRHRDAMKLRSEHADIWVEEREEHIERVTAFIEQHSPIMIEDETVDPAVLEAEMFLRKVFEAAIASVLHAAMGAENPIVHDHLVPAGIGPRTSQELLQALCSYEWANPSRLVHLSEICV